MGVNIKWFIKFNCIFLFLDYFIFPQTEMLYTPTYNIIF
jgi:hypothetical protein